MSAPEVVADNASPADLGDEPEGFWEPVHAQVDKWATKYGTNDVGYTD